MIRTIITLIFFAWVLAQSQPAQAGGFFDRKPAEIVLEDASDLSELIALNLVIGSVNGRTAKVFLTPEEFDWVRGLGLAVQWLAIPDERRTLSAEGYPSYAAVTARLKAYAEARPDICVMESAGQSIEGRELWWLKITDRVLEKENEPEVHFIGTIHGDEPLGTVLSLRLIDYLIGRYGSDEQVTRLVDETEIWIMPVINPDGMEAGSRFNAAGVDLNRDFPDPAYELTAVAEGRQPETVAVMNWAQAHTPALAANFHSGALVVNYPWDSDMDGDNATEYEVAPDDALFRFIAGVYASNNPLMMSGPFPEGITNGSNWYPIRGGMQDWLYRYHGCLALTVELSEEGYPDPSTFEEYWEANRNAMLAFMDLARMGIHGVVTDAKTGEPLHAQIRVDGIDAVMYSDPDVGDYYRMLLPGEYILEFTADGYRSATHAVVVNADAPRVLDVELAPLNSSSDGGMNPPSNEGTIVPPGGGAGSSSGGGGGGGGCFIDTLTDISFKRQSTSVFDLTLVAISSTVMLLKTFVDRWQFRPPDTARPLRTTK